MKRFIYLLTIFLFISLLATAGASAPPPWQANHPAGVLAGGVFFDSGQALGNALSHGVVLGDLNGNGFVDAFVANSPGPNEVWLNDGAGSFTSNGQSLGNSDSQAVALGDLNGNGYLDAVVANVNGLNQIWLNDGSGHFAAGQAFEAANSRHVALGDLNDNGRLDAIFANPNGNTVWFNDGDGTFSDSGQSLGLFDSAAVALADLNGNGRLDAFFANIAGGADTVWFNDGSGVFSDSGQRLGIGWSNDVALGDLNDNGFVDAFIASSFPEPNLVWLNDGQGFFSDSLQRLGATASNGVALADVTGDNKLDAIVANNYPDGIQVWFNDGHAFFADSGQALGQTLTYDIALADLDGDGAPDIFAANAGANQVWLNQAAAAGADLALTPSSRHYYVDYDGFGYSSLTIISPITVTNLGPDMATNVALQSSWSRLGQIEMLSASWNPPSQGSCDQGGYTCDLGALAHGAAATAWPVLLLTSYASGTYKGDVTLNSAVAGSEPDPYLANNITSLTWHFFDCTWAGCALATIFCRSTFPPIGAAAGRDYQRFDWFSGASGLVAASGLPRAINQLRLATDVVIHLPLYYRLRDEILQSTAAGQRYIDLYNTHDPEILSHLLADETLWDQAVTTLQLWQPNLQALVTGEGDNAIITAEQVAAIDGFLSQLSAVASPELQQVIAEERARLGPPADYVGMSVNEARGLIIGYSIKLPLVRRD